MDVLADMSIVAPNAKLSKDIYLSMGIFWAEDGIGYKQPYVICACLDMRYARKIAILIGNMMIYQLTSG